MLGVALGIRNVQSQLPDIVYALLSGLNSATVGLIALAAVQLSEKAITNKMTRLIICLTACVGLLYRGLPLDFFTEVFSAVVLSDIDDFIGNFHGHL
jgi:chromate transport protein ChrA